MSASAMAELYCAVPLQDEQTLLWRPCDSKLLRHIRQMRVEGCGGAVCVDVRACRGVVRGVAA